MTWSSQDPHSVLCVHLCSVLTDSATPWTVAARLLYPWNFSGKNTEVGCHFLLQGTFLIRGSNPHLFHFLHWQASSLHLEPPGKPLSSSALIYIIGIEINSMQDSY